jgi:hypothetical protein
MENLEEVPSQFFELVSCRLPKQNQLNNPQEGLKIIEGYRNDSLARIAGYFNNLKMNRSQMEYYLNVLNVDLCSPPLGVSEVNRIANSIARYPSKTKTELESVSSPISIVRNIQDFMNDETVLAPVPVILRLINLSELFILSGPAKAGKSLLALAFGISVSTGNMFLNYFETKKMKVLYLQTEIGPFQLKERISKMILGEVELLSEDLSICFERIKIDKKDGIALVRKIITEGRFKFIILDPFYTLHNSAEDSSSEIAPILTDLRQIAIDLQVAILLIHHQGKRKEDSGQTGHKHRGSSSFADVPDGSLSLKKIDKDTAVLDFELRNLETPDSIKLNLQDLQWTFHSSNTEQLKISIDDISDFLASEGELSYTSLAKGVADKTGTSERLVKDKIAQARKSGRILFRKEGKNTYYSLGANVQVPNE